MRKSVIRITLLRYAIVLVTLAWAGSPADAYAQPACAEGEQAAGAIYRICMPPQWNGDLVVYAHGYVGVHRPVGIPKDQFQLEGAGEIDRIVTDRNYAFAASSYRVNGLAVEEGIEDLLDVVEIFVAQHGQPGRILLVGVSEGGLIAALSMERHAWVYDGALALCGPYGDFRRQIDYMGDFRVVFDVLFPELVPPSPIEIPPALLDVWETETYSTTVKPLVEDPTNASTVTQLLTATGAPFDPEDPATREATIDDLLWYNIYATNDARAKLGGQPFDNVDRRYTGAADDDALNANVARFAADAPALNTIATVYETRGTIGGPLVTLHTTGDPVIPVWHVAAHRAKVLNAGRGGLHEAFVFERYGHCSFALLEILAAFDRLVELVEETPRQALYIPSVMQ